MQFATVNIDALKRAIDAVVGPGVGPVIEKVYVSLDSAMQNSYNEGHLAGGMETERRVEAEAQDALQTVQEQARSDGYLMGFSDGADEGYLDGVHDARAFPAEADRNVEEIMAQDAQDALDVIFEDEYQRFPNEISALGADYTVKDNAQVEGFDYDKFFDDEDDLHVPAMYGVTPKSLMAPQA